MTRSSEQRIADALDAIHKCRIYSARLRDDEELREMAEDAIERNLQILGEAVNHLPSNLTESYPQIPWPQTRGFRNILVHGYFGVDSEVIEEVVADHLAPLEDALKDMLTQANDVST